MNSDPSSEALLAANISSRICHDLVSPVGAIVNGIDLIREIGPGGLAEEFSMISQSAERASSLLQFYRIAFGAADTGSIDVARSVLIERARALIASPRILLKWTSEAGPAFPRSHARLMCLLLLCARTITGMSGQIHIRFDGYDSLPFSISVETDKTGDALDVMHILTGTGPSQEITPRTVEFFLAVRSAGLEGITLGVDTQPGRVAIHARPG